MYFHTPPIFTSWRDRISRKNTCAVLFTSHTSHGRGSTCGHLDEAGQWGPILKYPSLSKRPRIVFHIQKSPKITWKKDVQGYSRHSLLTGLRLPLPPGVRWEDNCWGVFLTLTLSIQHSVCLQLSPFLLLHISVPFSPCYNREEKPPHLNWWFLIKTPVHSIFIPPLTRKHIYPELCARVVCVCVCVFAMTHACVCVRVCVCVCVNIYMYMYAYVLCIYVRVYVCVGVCVCVCVHVWIHTTIPRNLRLFQETLNP